MSPDVRIERASSADFRYERWLLWILTGYFALCSITIPFINEWWLSELPVLAVVQLPKIETANWLRSGIVMKIIEMLGWSKGSFSPDYGTARTYALAIVYLVSLVVVSGIFWLRNRKNRSSLWPVIVLLAVASVDFMMTLFFASQRGLTIY